MASLLRGSCVSTQAHLYVHVQHIVVDLEEPSTLRPTIGWPACGAMRHPAYGLLRIPQPVEKVVVGPVGSSREPENKSKTLRKRRIRPPNRGTREREGVFQHADPFH